MLVESMGKGEGDVLLDFEVVLGFEGVLGVEEDRIG